MPKIGESVIVKSLETAVEGDAVILGIPEARVVTEGTETFVVKRTTNVQEQKINRTTLEKQRQFHKKQVARLDQEIAMLDAVVVP